MESLTDFGYSGVDNCIKVHLFLQGIKSIELEAVVNVVQAQSGKYCMDFDATASYLGQMVMKEDPSMQYVNITKTISQLF